MQAYYVYILTNVSRNVMYVGVTNDLERRLADHDDERGISTRRLPEKSKSKVGVVPRRTPWFRRQINLG